jgi:uncharacterized protein (DUF1697 family)
MALKGSLEDLGVVDLIQFVHQAHKSGNLLLTGPDGKAEFYYRKGSLVDARMGDCTGLEVLVRIVDWCTGDFEFLPGEDDREATIQMDVHHAVMNAVKIRDERRMEEEKRKAEMEAKTQQAAVPAFGNQLQALVSGIAFLQYACVLDSKGQALAEAQGAHGGVKGIEDLRACLHRFAESYPREELKRIFIEDRAGTVVLAGMSEGRVLITVSDGATSLGGVSVSVGKLVSRLNL